MDRTLEVVILPARDIDASIVEGVMSDVRGSSRSAGLRTPPPSVASAGRARQVHVAGDGRDGDAEG